EPSPEAAYRTEQTINPSQPAKSEQSPEAAPEPEQSAESTISETGFVRTSSQTEQQAPSAEAVSQVQPESIEDTKAAADSSTTVREASVPEVKAAEAAPSREARRPNIPKNEPETGKKIIVIVNQKPIVMRGKQSYMFVDIFDYIDFDTSRMRGSGIATLVNGRDAQYTQELYNGDKIEVYWK
ncbi:MAG: hypothetical protein K2L86_07175, partial [Lachnospiraceae bacterium]|nr:hypothetical protein [Lachnospiraceae bacterium]